MPTVEHEKKVTSSDSSPLLPFKEKGPGDEVTKSLYMPFAARVGDMHTCPMINPGGVPHVGGPVMPAGCPTVLIGGMPAARVGDMLVCTGPPDTIAAGSSTVTIGGAPAARVGDATAHGGSVILGCFTVMIGG